MNSDWKNAMNHTAKGFLEFCLIFKPKNFDLFVHLYKKIDKNKIILSAEAS